MIDLKYFPIYSIFYTKEPKCIEASKPKDNSGEPKLPAPALIPISPMPYLPQIPNLDGRIRSGMYFIEGDLRFVYVDGRIKEPINRAGSSRIRDSYYVNGQIYQETCKHRTIEYDEYDNIISARIEDFNCDCGEYDLSRRRGF